MDLASAPHEPLGEAPLIVRVAGLAGTLPAAFASALGCRASELQRLDTLLDEARARRVERLHEAINGAPTDTRRLLLALKRDSFNGRSLRKYRDRPHWVCVLAAIGPLAEEMLLLEERRDLLAADFAAAYAAQLERERAALAACARDRRFLRGVALSSYVLVDNLARLERPAAGLAQSRERRLTLALLRYASRAALKVSPFSTLTRLGLCLVTDRPDVETFQLAGPAGAGAWGERSKVDLHRSLVEQVSHMLLRHPPFRAALAVERNETLGRGADGEHTFVRPGRYEGNATTGKVLYSPPAQVRVRLDGPLVEWLLARPAMHESYGALLDTLCRELGEPRTDVQDLVDRLLDLGFLCFAWPWQATEEAAPRLLAFLDQHAADPGLAASAASLRRVLDLIEGYAGADLPARTVDAGNQAMRELLAGAARLAGIDPGVSARASAEGFFHEDVVASSDLPAGEVALLPAARARLLADDLLPLVRLSNLFSLRTDILQTLAAAAAERWPGRDTVPLLELVAATFPLFREYIRFDVATRADGPLKPRSFNPRQLANLAELSACRERVAEALPRLLAPAAAPGGLELRLPPAALARLLDDLPPAATRARDFCAFLQPADAAAERWLLNTCFEGWGRMSSRYTATMPAAMSARFASLYQARALEADGELVDILWPGGNSVNVHAPRTARVLTLPGQAVRLPEERRLTLRDLDVRLRGDRRLPELVDRAGRRVLPVHLGAITPQFLPSLAKFLALFGPGELRLCRPLAPERRVAADVDLLDRHVAGGVVYQRRRWSAEPAGLREEIGRHTGAAALLAVHRWRTARSIPERVYLAERLPTAERPHRTKPQYIDLTSCHFVEMLRAALERAGDRLRLTEALPLPEDMPVLGGERWATEIQLESCGVPPRANQGRPPAVGRPGAPPAGREKGDP